jgi:hypothetical protein
LEGGVLISKSNEIAEKMNIEYFQATGGWLEKFQVKERDPQLQAAWRATASKPERCGICKGLAARFD